ncbi:platelet-activating factor acetylhydrolase-like isoform X2 [Oratosquilla oratoria]
MARSYLSSRKHTPIPQGPYVVGCSDVMVGRTKEGTLMRLFYPSSLTDIKAHMEDWTPWYLGEEYTRGIANFMASAIPSLFSMLFNWQLGGSYTPAVWEAKMANEKFPVVVFSHGLSGNRSIYSTVCSELASHGFVVAAIEHRDTSACASFTLDEEGKQEFVPFRVLKYGEKEYDLRNQQVKVRVEESIRALDILEKLNLGGISNELPSKFDLKQLRGNLDLSQPVMAGHSFGGGTTIFTLAKDHRFKVGVALDPWMFPIKDDASKICPAVHQPLICISTEAFQADANLRAMKFLNSDTTKCITIRGTVHQNQCDTPFLVGAIGRALSGASSPLDPMMAMDINNRLFITFLCKHLGLDRPFYEKYETYIEENKKHLVYDLYGTSKKMLGWDP